MNNSLENKCALICGASDGIGFGIAEELAQSGAVLIMLGRTPQKLKEKFKVIKKISDKDHIMMIVDFNFLEDVKSKLDTLLKTKKVDILINNTGGPAPGPLMSASLDQLKDAFKTHVLASHMISQLVIPNMIDSNHGRIVNITSTSIRQPIMGLGVSNTIRGAMGSWSKTLALELAQYGITVNNILPGTTKTNRLTTLIQTRQKTLNLSKEEVEKTLLDEIPMGRFAEVSEISKSVGFLVSSHASYITGMNFQVDGGKIKSI